MPRRRQPTSRVASETITGPTSVFLLHTFAAYICIFIFFSLRTTDSGGAYRITDNSISGRNVSSCHAYNEGRRRHFGLDWFIGFVGLAEGTAAFAGSPT